MPNVIDELGAKVVGNRYKGEDDQEYAARVLDRLYRSWQAINAEGWTGDQETNEYALVKPNGAAYVARGKRKWLWCVALDGESVAEGRSRYLEKALQICSLALSP